MSYVKLRNKKSEDGLERYTVGNELRGKIQMMAQKVISAFLRALYSQGTNRGRTFDEAGICKFRQSRSFFILHSEARYMNALFFLSQTKVFLQYGVMTIAPTRSG